MKRGTAFRAEFPFLNNKDCPVELEVLATRKITEYHRYVDLHKKLIGCASLEECAELSNEIIDNYLDNRMIWEELHYYQQHGAILGKHPMFTEFRNRQRLNKMNIYDLFKRKQQVENNIWRVKNEMSKGDKPHLNASRRARLEGYEKELADINRLLN